LIAQRAARPGLAAKWCSRLKTYIWRALLGTDLKQALLPSLLPILIAMLMPIAVIILLLMR